MQKACRIVCETYDKSNGEVIARDELLNINIAKPKIIDEIGLEYDTQLRLVRSSIDKVIDKVLLLMNIVIAQNVIHLLEKMERKNVWCIQ